jgi:hypothetical protein
MRSADGLVADAIRTAATATAGRSAAPPLARYVDGSARIREVVTLDGLKRSVLVVDRDAATLGDARLVAHLAFDEPPENAALVCAGYLDQVRGRDCRCRELTSADFQVDPLHPADAAPADDCPGDARPPIDGTGCVYRLQSLPVSRSAAQLRWCRCPPRAGRRQWAVSVREAVAALESYEPIRSLTLRALQPARVRPGLSTAVLRAELTRVQLSPIVLNRGLREAVLARMERDGLSMSEIALRCGRVKRDASGVRSGETSWLGRRLGLLSEGGKERPTPWIHSNVLALIARQGLGISPREVELG